MRKPKKRVKLVNEFSGIHLAPEHCGSSIRWRVCLSQSGKGCTFDSEINLTDCSRTITWSGYGSDGLDEMDLKIANAIEDLTKLYGVLGEVRRVWRKAGRAAGLKVKP